MVESISSKTKHVSNYLFFFCQKSHTHTHTHTFFHNLSGLAVDEAQKVKVSASNVGDPGSIPGSRGICPGEGNGNPTLIFLPGRSHGQRSLVGCSPWGCKELDVTERLHFCFQYYHKSCVGFKFICY